MSVLERIESLYLWHGRRVCEHLCGEPFTVLEHALQTAQLAEWDDAGDAVQLRLYDDRAKVPGRKTPPLAYFLDLLEAYEGRRGQGPRIAIASLSVA